MADTETTEGRVPEDATPPDKTGKQDEPPKTETPAEPVDDFDKDRAMATIAKLRDAEKEGKRAARERDELAARLKEREDADLSEQDRIAKERDEAIAERDSLRESIRRNEIKLAVYGLRDEKGLASPDLALAALDFDQITFDKDGNPENVAELIDDLLEREPILKGTTGKPKVPKTDGGDKGDRSPDLTADELEAAELSGMTPERYAAVKAAMGGKKSVSVGDVAAALAPKG